MSNPSFEFKYQDNLIQFESTHFGQESLFLNKTLIESKRNILGFTSRYKMNIGGKEVHLVFKVLNPFTGRLECNLYESGELISKKWTKAKLGEKNKVLSIILLLLLTGMLGLFIPVMGSFVWLSPIIFIACVTTAMSVRERIYEVHTKET